MPTWSTTQSNTKYNTGFNKINKMRFELDLCTTMDDLLKLIDRWKADNISIDYHIWIHISALPYLT